jgi:hypothetical protein
VQKTQTVSAPRRIIRSVLSFECFNSSFTKTCHRRHRRAPYRQWLHLGRNYPLWSLEFIVDRFGNLSLSIEGKDSGAMFVGMTHNESPPLHTILEESVDEGDTTSSGGGSSDFSIS